MMDNNELIVLSHVWSTSGTEHRLCDLFGFDWTCIFSRDVFRATSQNVL